MTQEELAARPSLEEIVTSYDAMLTEVREALTSEFPGGEWTTQGEDSSNMVDSSLPEGFRARSVIHVYSISTSGSEADKERALNVVGPVVARYGFALPSRYVDGEGRMQATGDDGYGGIYDLGSSKKTTVRYTTGVHRKNAS